MKKESKTLVQAMEKESETLGPSEFSFAITKVAVVQICQSVGFKAGQSSAIETLTRISTIYLQTLAKCASSSAAASGRTQSNLFDLVHALEDLSSVNGFIGASKHARCLLASTLLRDVINFVKSRREIPFAKPIPRQNPPPPLPQKPSNPKSSSHIPTWLPGFPDSSTYAKPKIPIRGDVLALERTSSGTEKEKNPPPVNTDLPKKRETVRFEIGGVRVPRLGFKVRICREGKRVSWQHHYFDKSKFEKPR